MTSRERQLYADEWDIHDAEYDEAKLVEEVVIGTNYQYPHLAHPQAYYHRIVRVLRHILRRRLTEAHHYQPPHRGIRFQLVVRVEYRLLSNPEGEAEYRDTYTHGYYEIVSGQDVNSQLKRAWADIVDQIIEEGSEVGSNYAATNIDQTRIITWFVEGASHIQGYNTRSRARRERERKEEQDEENDEYDDIEEKYNNPPDEDMGGGSYIVTPAHIATKKCVISTQNNDELCFQYVMELGALHYLEVLEKKNVQTRFKSIIGETLRFDYSKCSWPFHHNDLDSFINSNHDYRFNIRVYYYPKKNEPIQILRNITETDADFFLNLLWIEEEDNAKKPNAHWALITNLNSFLRLSNSKHYYFYCPVCLNQFSNKEQLEKHEKDFRCGSLRGKEVVSLSYPPPDLARRSFEDIVKSTMAHFMIYADTESILIPIQHSELPLTAQYSSTMLTAHHVTCAASFISVCQFDSSMNSSWSYHASEEPKYDPVRATYTSDVGDKFLAALEEESKRIMSFLLLGKRHVPEGSAEQMKEYEKANLCCLCHLPFDPRVQLNKWSDKRRRTPTIIGLPTDKVKHYNPYLPANNVIGAAHARCNWDALTYCFTKEYTDPTEFGRIGGNVDDRFSVTVSMHNWSGYDQTVILNSMTKRNVKVPPTCIGATGEKFKMLNFNRLQFVDSMAFLKASLETLMSRLAREDFKLLEEQIQILCKQRGLRYTESMLPLLTQKGEYPYEWFDCIAKFKNPELPPIEAFYSTLKDKHLTPEEYKHAQTVWEIFQCKTMQDYTEIYLMVDVLGLACVFESFRKITFKAFHLDPAHYFSLPQLTWDAGFVTATRCQPIPGPHVYNVEIKPFQIELFNDTADHQEMYHFSSSMLRGGNAMIGQRHWEKPEEVEGDPSTIEDAVYLDMNSLYPSAMSEKLPVGEFSWVPEEEITKLNATDIHKFITDVDWATEDYGCYIECDLVIPRELHTYFAQFPPAPQNSSVPFSWLSPFTQHLFTEQKRKHNSKIRKLVCTLFDKPNYRVHARLLKLYVEIGCQVTKIHRILRFKQEAWINPFISYCVEQRSKAKSTNEQEFWKLLMNAFYGKTLQNQKNYVDHTFIFESKKLLKMLNSGKYKSMRRVNKNCYIVTHHKGNALITSPIIVGNAVLEISKLLMYNFWYKEVIPRFGIQNLTLLMTDTDSLLFVMKTKRLYDVLAADKEFRKLFDFSDLPTDHPLYDESKRKQLKHFKDECKGNPIIKFAGLAAKMYAFICYYLEKQIYKTKITAKGISEAVRRTKLTYDSYVTALGSDSVLPPVPTKYTTHRIGTKNNQLFSITIEKDGLYAGDTKRFLIDYRTSQPFGYNPSPILPSPPSL